MTIPYDQTLAKLRILSRRAQKAADEARADYERKKAELWETCGVAAATNRAAEANGAYYNRARELGYCGWCENSWESGKCKCIILAI